MQNANRVGLGTGVRIRVITMAGLKLVSFRSSTVQLFRNFMHSTLHRCGMGMALGLGLA